MAFQVLASTYITFEVSVAIEPALDWALSDQAAGSDDPSVMIGNPR